MNNIKAKIIVIMGPTASGKSDAAIKLAKKFNGEIISADSRQIYRGMDIGSGKVVKDKTSIAQIDTDDFFISEGIIHHLIDVADPNEDFNISHFKKMTENAIEKILKKRKLPIICGGTGFWIQAITNQTNLPEVPPNPQLRAALEKETAENLFNKISDLDPERAANIDKQNKYRLIRALEIIEAIGKVPSKSSVINHQSSDYDFLQIGINVTREVLNEKIKKRLVARLKEGMIEEVRRLHENGVSWERLEGFGLEYRWIARFLQDKISLEEMKEKLYFDIIHYAKRQMTWFNRNKKILWIDNLSEIEKAVAEFIEFKKD